MSELLFVCSWRKERQAISTVTCPSAEAKQTDASSSKKTLNLIIPKTIDKEIVKGSMIVILVAKEVTDDSLEQILPTVVPILKEFTDVFLEELPDSLPPMRDIQHAINFVTGSALPTYLITEWIGRACRTQEAGCWTVE